MKKFIRETAAFATFIAVMMVFAMVMAGVGVSVVFEAVRTASRGPGLAQALSVGPLPTPLHWSVFQAEQAGLAGAVLLLFLAPAAWLIWAWMDHLTTEAYPAERRTPEKVFMLPPGWQPRPQGQAVEGIQQRR